VACSQEKHLGTDPLCRHILTTVFGRIADTAQSSGSHVCLMTLHNPVESLVALPYLPTAALVVFSQKKYHCTSLAMICVLPGQLREENMLLGTLASRVPSLVQSCSRPRCVEHFWDKHEQNITFLDRIMVGSLKGAGYGIVGLFLHKGFFHTVSALQR